MNEVEVKVAGGLGDADPSQVMAGATFTSETGFNQTGAFIPSADNISFDDTTAQIGASTTQEAIETATNIAKGRNQAHVFNTTADMQAWLSNADNKGLWNKSDNILIVDIDVPDWWVAEVLEEADPNTGYYYRIEMLETQKVDLTNYVATGSTANLKAIVLDGSDFAFITNQGDDDITFRYKGADGGNAWVKLSALMNSLNAKLPLAGGVLTGGVRTKDLIPDTPETNVVGSSTAPYQAMYSKYHVITDGISQYINLSSNVKGTEETVGLGLLVVGNTIPRGTNGNARGWLRLCGPNTYYHDITPNNNISENVSQTLSSKSGTIPTVAVSETSQGKKLIIRL